MNIQQSQIDRLIEETQKGNTKAFGEVYDLYFPQIHKYIYYKVAKDQVDDLVGTVFIKAWTNIKKYKKGSFPFSSWLYRIAHNAVVDHYRTHREFYELEEKIADDDRLSPQAFAEKQLNGERVHQALRKLNKNYQEVILLKFMNELSNEEVAEAMQTNEGNVRTLQFRALKKMREVLEEQERMAAASLAKPETEQRPGLLRRLFARSSS